MTEKLESNQIVLYLSGEYMMQLETTWHMSHVTCQMSHVTLHITHYTLHITQNRFNTFYKGLNKKNTLQLFPNSKS